MKRTALVLVICAIASAELLPGQSAGPARCSIRVTGDLKQPVTLTPEHLASLPHQEIRAAVHGQDTALYAGVRLAEVLRLAGVKLGPGLKGAGVSQYVVIRAGDGYRAVYSVAELDSAMTKGEVWLADRKNGGVMDSTEGPCRMLVPSDRRGARSVRQITTIEFHQVP